jgi:hypothetical protein
MVIIGIDYSAQKKLTGLALGDYNDSTVRILSVCSGFDPNQIVQQVRQWLKTDGPHLLAIDAPLGWPCLLSNELLNHQAGMPIGGERATLFFRLTDRVVHDELKKWPLPVGADRIAATAKSALDMIQVLRQESGLAIPLAWHYENMVDPSAIEVYPSATLKSHGMKFSGYKDDKNKPARKELIKELNNHVKLGSIKTNLEDNDNLLDAVICVLAASDFLRGQCLAPEDILGYNKELVEKEGWIWFMRQSTSQAGVRI